MDFNHIQDKLILPFFDSSTEKNSIKLKFFPRRAIVHCPGCHVSVNLEVSDFGVKHNMYEVWPQRAEKDLE